MKKIQLFPAIIAVIILATGSLFAIPLLDKDPDNDPDKKQAKVKAVTIVNGVETTTDTIINIDDIDIEVMNLENIEINIDSILNEVTTNLNNISFNMDTDEITEEVTIQINGSSDDASFNINIDNLDEIIEMTLENIDADNKTICKKIIISDDMDEKDIKVYNCNGAEDLDIDVSAIVEEIESSLEGVDAVKKVHAVVIETKCMELNDAELRSLESAGIKADKNNQLELNNLSISPNPSNGNIKLNFESTKEETVKINIFDMNGKKVFSEKVKNFDGKYSNSIDLTNEKSGTYFVNISQGKEQVTKKVVLK
jgi:hypothetical protein